MPRFLLIDQSLRGPAGHHLNYDVEVLRAAAQARFQVALATRRRFACGALPPSWQVRRVFAQDAYRTQEIGEAERIQLIGRSTRWSSWRRAELALRKRRAVQRHRQSCRRFLSEFPLTDGDHVFAPTSSDVDFAGLAQAATSLPGAARATWHVQFHFDFLHGEPAEADAAERRIDALRTQFASALQPGAPPFQFYCPTRELAELHQRLGVGDFATLPYIVGRDFLAAGKPNAAPARPESEPRSRPLQVTCAGYPRREKGRLQLAALIRALWPVGLARGKLKMALQCTPAHWRRITTSLADLSPAAIQAAVTRNPPALSRPAYFETIRAADIGLFLYDPKRYRRRCSGVLLEMLACGVPVVVPARCWLAERMPRGVGLTYDEPRQIPSRIEELSGDYPTFRAAAQRAALQLQQRHSAEAVLRHLTRGAAASVSRGSPQTGLRGALPTRAALGGFSHRLDEARSCAAKGPRFVAARTGPCDRS